MINVTCALIVRKNKILITQHGEDSDHPFQWEFPGGKINPHETEKECIIREIREELDLEIEILKKMVPVEFDYGIKKVRLIPFLCVGKSEELKLQEHHDFRWIEINELGKIDFSEADKKLVKKKENVKLLKEYFGKNMHNTR